MTIVKVQDPAASSFLMMDALRRSPIGELPGASTIMREAIHRSVEVYEGRLDGELACIWGMIPPTLLSDTAYMWLLTTDIVAENKFLFIRYSQRWVEEALKVYTSIIGDVMVDNEPAKRWLRFLGAEFERPIGRKIPFKIRRKANG